MNRKSAQVSTTLLNILADLNNGVILMVIACPLISNRSSPFQVEHLQLVSPSPSCSIAVLVL